MITCGFDRKPYEKGKIEKVEINLKTLLDWIMKGIVFIVVITLLAGTGAFLYTRYFVPKTYKAEVKFCAGSEDTGNGTSGFNYYKSVAPQLVELLNVREFYDEVAVKLSSIGEKEYTGSDVQGMVKFSGVVEETSIFYARVTAKEPTEAYNVAVAVAECAPDRIKAKRSSDTLMVASMPVVPTSPASPNVRNNTVYGALAGLVLSVFLVIMKELLDNNIKTSEEITELFGLPVLGVVPDFSNQEKEGK